MLSVFTHGKRHTNSPRRRCLSVFYWLSSYCWLYLPGLLLRPVIGLSNHWDVLSLRQGRSHNSRKLSHSCRTVKPGSETCAGCLESVWFVINLMSSITRSVETGFIINQRWGWNGFIKPADWNREIKFTLSGSLCGEIIEPTVSWESPHFKTMEPLCWKIPFHTSSWAELAGCTVSFFSFLCESSLDRMTKEHYRDSFSAAARTSSTVTCSTQKKRNWQPSLLVSGSNHPQHESQRDTQLEK